MQESAEHGELEAARHRTGDYPRASLWLALLLIVTLAIRILDPIDWLGSDDASYYAAAEHILQGETMHRVHHQFARSPIVLSVAASMALFGASPVTLALPMLLASVLCVALIAYIGRLVWGWWEGLCAATILSFNPIFLNTSTAVLPDVIACLLASAAILMALLAAPRLSTHKALWLAVGCGFLLGMATSAKVFNALSGIGVVVILWTRAPQARGRKGIWLCVAALAFMIFFALEATFYSVVAGDFLYKAHALANTRAVMSTATPGPYTSLAGVAGLVWQTFTMPLRTTISTWGTIGMAFWPVTLAALFLSRRGRGIAAWAVGVFAVVAFLPISFENGPRPYHAVWGRNIMVVCAPFALCGAWALRRMATRFMSAATARACLPVLLLAIATISTIDRVRLNAGGPGSLTLAVDAIIASAKWDQDRDLFMAPSLYWRYRILFPPDLRARLRVAADEDAPDWWRDMTVDMRSRWAPLPPPGSVDLLATPTQLAGDYHTWDYGVGLPTVELQPWRRVEPRLVAALARNGRIRAGSPQERIGKPLLVLLGTAPSPGNRQLAQRISTER